MWLEPCFVNLGEPAAVVVGTLGDVAPVHDRAAELLVARVDFSGKLVAGANVGNDFGADLQQSLKQRIVEFQDLDSSRIAQFVQ
jgi:hypothetical protein